MSSKRKGFTLIELLVVILIIGVLAAILLPVFARVRDRGRQVACSSNVRQMGFALRMYLDDYKQCFPIVDTPAATAAGDDVADLYAGYATPGAGQIDYVIKNSFFAQIEPYLESRNVHVCLSDPLVRAEPTAGYRYSS